MESTIKIIESLYRRLLLRDPDLLGMQKHQKEFMNSNEQFDELIIDFLESIEFQEKIHIFCRHYGGNNIRFTNDHSQYGEFEQILKFFMGRFTQSKIVVDVGANGKERSNSFDLINQFGWKGVLIEANPKLYSSIENDFFGLNYTLVKSAVSDIEGMGTLSLGINSDISSLSAESTSSWGEVSDKINVKTRRLAGILEENMVPSSFALLSIDIEGYDVRVLNDLICKSDFRPEMIIIELAATPEQHTTREGIETYDLESVGLAPEVADIYRYSGRTKSNVILTKLKDRSNTVKDIFQVNDVIKISEEKVALGSIRTNNRTLQLYARETCTLTVWVENLSSWPWSSSEECRVNLSYHWKNKDGGMLEYDGVRTGINGIINKNEITEQRINVTAPNVPGAYILELTLVKEDEYWFDEKGFETMLIQTDIVPLTEINPGHYTNDLRDFIVTESNRAEGFFDAEWYTVNYPDVVAAKLDPFDHYMNHGYIDGRNPGPEFDTNFYLQTYPDVASAGVNPLYHFLCQGRAEGRAPNAKVQQGIRHVIVKEMDFTAGGEAAILVTHSPLGRLKPHVLPYIELLRDSGLSVLLVVVTDRPLDLTGAEAATADGILVRDNFGYDFGAWAHAFKLNPELYGARLLIMTNDSVIPTANAQIFRAMVEMIRANPADIVGLTASHEYGWHIQSYFQALKPKALASWAFQHFIRDIGCLNDKDAIIHAYEVPFAGNMQATGLSVATLFDPHIPVNPTLFGWRELIAQGFPFVKLLLLRGQFAEADIEDWESILSDAGFDVEMVRASILVAKLSAPAGKDNSLIVNSKRFEAINNDHRLRIAYFGPWNYDNGLGGASRELIGALRKTDFQLNIYPIKKPFHIHRLIGPAIEILDYDGRPDVAIVHLNPDSWHLLTDEQKEIITSAKQRIGYWVWETDTLPPAWRHDLYSVDRIWAPSTYCAEIFATEVGVPVDVVPHPVQVPHSIPDNRNSLLRRFQINPDQRVILYIFDGSSYLIRKNPEALVRAFAASKLAESGWLLVLKVKHLHDRPEAGKALTELVNATLGVRIIDATLDSEEIINLLAAADIYVSPHCSEGFGLTVAEAMALGKPVVATDFSGTRDFLNISCGYPVSAKAITLTENHGHYLKGHGWAKIDEFELATTLARAADDVLNGSAEEIGSMARANIATLLSYDSVASAIKKSISATVKDTDRKLSFGPRSNRVTMPPAPSSISVDLSAALPFANLVAADGVVPVPLASDFTCSSLSLPEGFPEDWLFFAPGDARVAPDAFRFIRTAALNRPDVVLFYSDDVAAGEDSMNILALKPDFDRTLITAQDYIGSPIIVRRKTLTAVGGLDYKRGTAVLYELVLRIAKFGGSISRIPQVLIGHVGKRPTTKFSDRQVVLGLHATSSKIEFIEGAAPGVIVQRRMFDENTHPPVTIIIPTRQTRKPRSSQTYIEQLLSGISAAEWPMQKVTVLIGDDIAGTPAWIKKKWPFRLVRIETVRGEDKPFNYSAKMNLLWRQSNDEQIIFMNDDMVPVGTKWLSALLTFSVDGSVGGVGGRLYYEDGSIQHAGIFPSLRTVVHAWLGWPADAPTYFDQSICQREWSMVTGAIFATKRSILEKVGGFDERFSLEFNDIDICLRMRNLGYRIVYNPEVEFIHAEKASRGETIPPGAEVALFLSRWTKWLEHDPSSHPGFAKNQMGLVPIYEPDAWYLKK